VLDIVRQFLCLLLLICLPLQSFAAQIDGVRALNAAVPSHEFEHAEDLHHHHEDDGSVHYDNSDESLEHADEHSPANQLSFLSPGIVSFEQAAVSVADYPDPASALPNPCLDDPPRPPSFAPGLAAGG
jgi:hypothetical protein